MRHSPSNQEVQFSIDQAPEQPTMLQYCQLLNHGQQPNFDIDYKQKQFHPFHNQHNPQQQQQQHHHHQQQQKSQQRQQHHHHQQQQQQQQEQQYMKLYDYHSMSNSENPLSENHQNFQHKIHQNENTLACSNQSIPLPQQHTMISPQTTAHLTTSRHNITHSGSENTSKRTPFDINIINQPEEQYEEIDEDCDSDFEEEEHLRQIYNSHRERFVQMNVTSSLLKFAETVTTELQKYFVRNKDQEDTCDIYEDKWATTKSGRELYYADLLRIAQGDTESTNKTSKKSNTTASRKHNTKPDNSLPSSFTIRNGSDDNGSQSTGVREESLGLGPLAELFDHGLKNCDLEKRTPEYPIPFLSREEGDNTYEYLTLSSRGENNKEQNSSAVEGIPMQERHLPESFWKEPSTLVNRGQHDLYYSNKFNNPHNKATYLATQKLPDFTDLMESWQGDTDKNT